MVSVEAAELSVSAGHAPDNLVEAGEVPAPAFTAELLAPSENRTSPTMLLINTRVSLTDISDTRGMQVTLGSVTQTELNAIVRGNPDALYLLGIWPVGPEVRQDALGNISEYRVGFPQLQEDDVIGSVFARNGDQPDERVAKGGWEELGAFRRELNRQGIKLFFDYIPNHVGIGHPWVMLHPDWFIRVPADRAQGNERDYYKVVINGEKQWFAKAKDPNYGPYSDCLQLNFASEGLQNAMIAWLLEIQRHCDGVRCDMAMFANSGTFIGLWGDHLTPDEIEWIQSNSFWKRAIEAVRKQEGGEQFEIIAEAYWDEGELLEAGFTGIYAKESLYKLLTGVVFGNTSPESVVSYLRSLTVQERSKQVRFIENHDERRAGTFGWETAMVLAAITGLIPGGYFLVHQGQREGRLWKIPMQITRAPKEAVNHDMVRFYNNLFLFRNSILFQEGEWSVPCIDSSHPDNTSYRTIVPLQFELPGVGGAILCANLGHYTSECHMHVPPGVREIAVFDLTHGAWLPQDGIAQPNQNGFFVLLPPRNCQIVVYHGPEQTME